MCQNLSNPGHATLLDIAHCAPIIILCIHQHVEPAIVAECCRKKNDKREHVSFACVGRGCVGYMYNRHEKEKKELLTCLSVLGLEYPQFRICRLGFLCQDNIFSTEILLHW